MGKCWANIDAEVACRVGGLSSQQMCGRSWGSKERRDKLWAAQGQVKSPGQKEEAMERIIGQKADPQTWFQGKASWYLWVCLFSCPRISAKTPYFPFKVLPGQGVWLVTPALPLH